jgi:hypothetical protein
VNTWGGSRWRSERRHCRATRCSHRATPCSVRGEGSSRCAAFEHAPHMHASGGTECDGDVDPRTRTGFAPGSFG